MNFKSTNKVCCILEPDLRLPLAKKSSIPLALPLSLEIIPPRLAEHAFRRLRSRLGRTPMIKRTVVGKQREEVFQVCLLRSSDISRQRFVLPEEGQQPFAIRNHLVRRVWLLRAFFQQLCASIICTFLILTEWKLLQFKRILFYSC